MTRAGLSRRSFIATGASLAGTALISGPALADTYPSEPVRLVLGYSPGGSTDNLARLLSPYLSESLGQPVIIENKPGANGSIAHATVQNAKPDGHTLTLSNSSLIVAAPHALKDAQVNPVTDLRHIMMMTSGRLVLLKSPALKDKGLDEIVEMSRAQPNTLAHASTGIGSTNELAFEMFRRATDSSFVTVQYKGTGPAMTDLLADRVHVTVAAVASAESYIREGSLGAVCVFGADRSEALPNVPSSKELGIEGLDDLVFWNGLHGPKDIPQEVVDTIISATEVALTNPELKQKLAGMRLSETIMESAAFTKKVVGDYEMFGEIYRSVYG